MDQGQDGRIGTQVGDVAVDFGAGRGLCDLVGEAERGIEGLGSCRCCHSVSLVWQMWIGERKETEERHGGQERRGMTGLVAYIRCDALMPCHTLLMPCLGALKRHVTDEMTDGGDETPSTRLDRRFRSSHSAVVSSREARRCISPRLPSTPLKRPDAPTTSALANTGPSLNFRTFPAPSACLAPAAPLHTLSVPVHQLGMFVHAVSPTKHHLNHIPACMPSVPPHSRTGP